MDGVHGIGHRSALAALQPTHMAKETHTYGKRNLHIWQKRPTHTSAALAAPRKPETGSLDHIHAGLGEFIWRLVRNVFGFGGKHFGPCTKFF